MSFKSETVMKYLIITFVLISFGSYSQNEYPRELTGSIGYEHMNKLQSGWQLLVTGAKPLNSHPRWSIGFNAGFGMTEYNRESGSQEIPPYDVIDPVGGGLVTTVTRRIYARYERLRLGIEGRYQLTNKEKGNLFLGASISGELITRWKDYGEQAYFAYDSTGNYTEVYTVPYDYDLSSDKIKDPVALYFQPYLDYRYIINEEYSLMIRGIGTTKLFPKNYPSVGPQINVGLSIRL